MKLHIKSNILLKNTFKDLIYLTDSAKLQIKKIQYNKKNNLLILPLKRLNLIGIKNGFLNLLKKPIYNTQELINSHIIIKNILNCEIINRCDTNVFEIVLLFGIEITGKEIYISSAEEDNGENLFEIKIMIDKYDIELKDI